MELMETIQATLDHLTWENLGLLPSLFSFSEIDLN